MAKKQSARIHEVEFMLTYEGDDSDTEPDFRCEKVRATDPDAACHDVYARHVGGIGNDGQECIDVTVTKCEPASRKGK